MEIESLANDKADKSAENLSAQNASLEKQIKETESKILETMNLLIESKALEVILNRRQKLIEKTNQQISETENEIKLLKTEIMDLEAAKSINRPTLNPLNNILIDKMLRDEKITSKEVENIMRSIDRGDFAPHSPYIDMPQSIGFGTTISAPHMHACQLVLLKDALRTAGRAIDIGCGSGYFTLAMAKLMPKGSKIYGIDHISKICKLATNNICKSHADFITDKKIEIVCADGRKGWPDGAPYDVIYVGGAISEVPQEMLDQLANGGILVAPVGVFTQELTCLKKSTEGEISKTVVLHCSFGKLQDKKSQWAGKDDGEEGEEQSSQQEGQMMQEEDSEYSEEEFF